MNKKIERINELVKTLNEAAKAYYQSTKEIMTNFEYDALYDELLSLELFKIVEENVLDYTITNFVESNENVLRYVDVEELRKLT